ncbi:hypothetical protein FOA52_006460 [Chlamydomonas sp. UWO 241]|nr:hypothetical protein FOA52_006460 [Chlamydomonas sp. UWO 241]
MLKAVRARKDLAFVDDRALFDAEVVPLMDARAADMARLEAAFATAIRTPGSSAAINVAANRGPYYSSGPKAPFEGQFYASGLWGNETVECPACERTPPPPPQQDCARARAALRARRYALAALADHMEGHARDA